MTPLTGVVGGPGRREALYGIHKGQKCENGFDDVVMRRSGLARSIEGTQEQRQIARRRLQQQFLVDIPAAPDIQPSHAAGVELMSKVAFDSLASRAL